MASLGTLGDAIAACLMFWVIIVSSFVINLLQLVSLILFRSSWSQALASHWWCLSQFVTETWSGVRFHFSGDDIFDYNETAVILSNHSPGIDNLPGVSLSSRAIGCGSVCTMIKSSLKLVPGLGWVNYLQGSLFLSRVWIRDRPLIQDRLRRLPRPLWVGIFPDGTRMTPDKRAASQRFARERHLPVLAHVLTPRTKGFVLALQTLGADLDAVYDATTCYEGSPLFLSDLLLRGAFRTRAVHLHLRRVPSTDLPDREADLEQWLYSAFATKDAMIDGFQKGGFLPGPVVHHPADHAHLFAVFTGWALGVALLGLYTAGVRSAWAALYLIVTLVTVALSFVRMRQRQAPGIAVGERDARDAKRAAASKAKIRSD